jgi:hypothetical protein
MEITATVPKLDNLEVFAEVNLGADLDEACALTSKEIVFSIYLAEAIIKAQAIMRALAIKGKTAEEIKATMAEWKPGSARVTGEAGLGTLLKRFGKLSPEKQKELIAKLLASSADEAGTEDAGTAAAE